MYVWGLQPHLGKAVALKYPTTIAQAAGPAEEIELAIRASQRPNLNQPGHVLLCHTVHEEDPQLRLDLLYKVEVEEMLAPHSEGDVVIEDDAEADGSVVVKAASKTLPRPDLAHSALAVASTDTMRCSVLKAQVHPAVVVLLNL